VADAGDDRQRGRHTAAHVPTAAAWGSAAFGWSFSPLAYALQHVEQSFESRK
jgi:hypothetical protein